MTLNFGIYLYICTLVLTPLITYVTWHSSDNYYRTNVISRTWTSLLLRI